MNRSLVRDEAAGLSVASSKETFASDSLLYFCARSFGAALGGASSTPRAEKGNPVRIRSSARYCKSPPTHPCVALHIATVRTKKKDGKAPRDALETSQETCRMRICITAHLLCCLRQAQARSCAPAHSPKAFGLGRLASAPTLQSLPDTWSRD